MKTVHKEEIYAKGNKISDRLFTDNSIFFDIETTGFSPTTSTLYLIGCARKKGMYICVDQFMAESKSEEKAILTAFLEILQQYDTIITYNGVGFDIPFIKAKCAQHGLSENLNSYNYLDIFKQVSELKPLLNFENYKQKTIEQFLKIKRDDKYTGGELINVYKEYTKSKDDALGKLLLLHNYEDVLGMIDLLPILSYSELVKGNYKITGANIGSYKSHKGALCEELIIEFSYEDSLPQHLFAKQGKIYLNLNPDKCSIRVPIVEDSLKFFYPNYKDYFYLPDEDTAIHKSVAEFVDKNHREKCKAYNCFTKRQGKFVPQYSSVMNPLFKKDYKDKISYFELTEDFLASNVMLYRYVNSLMALFHK